MIYHVQYISLGLRRSDVRPTFAALQWEMRQIRQHPDRIRAVQALQTDLIIINLTMKQRLGAKCRSIGGLSRWLLL